MKIPDHVRAIPELDPSDDLVGAPARGPWFRLAAWTVTPRRDHRRVEDVVSRQSILAPRRAFRVAFDKLEAIGNVLHGLGQPSGVLTQQGKRQRYRFAPFHRFKLPFLNISVEPMVFIRHGTKGAELLVNPDVWLHFQLEETAPGSVTWRDPRRGHDVIRTLQLDDDNLKALEIRTDYLLKYLQARQLSLIVGHYRHLHLYSPTAAVDAQFGEEEVTLGSPASGTKAMLASNRIGKELTLDEPLLRRRLDLWFEIKPPAIDAKDPWVEVPPFDPYSLTLPTYIGAVAPARWARFKEIKGRSFEGVHCDFMSRVYFRQEVLAKYQGASGFTISDNGSVRCHDYWGLERSTARIGNELLSTAIGDFAEGVPFEEWPHWHQYAVEPPGAAAAETMRQETSIPSAVNSVAEALDRLNTAFAALAAAVAAPAREPLWRGSLDSLAGRQLKWVYPSNAGDQDFLTRATLLSTFVIDELAPGEFRRVLTTMGKGLHQRDATSTQPLGSRNLLQRTTLIAALMVDLRAEVQQLPGLVARAEGRDAEPDSDLKAELDKLNHHVRVGFAPLAFLYDLRTFAGLAHPPNPAKAAEAAAALGLPKANWRRLDYLRLLHLVTTSIRQCARRMEVAAKAHVHGELDLG